MNLPVEEVIDMTLKREKLLVVSDFDDVMVSTVFNWYNKNKNNLMLGDTVDRYLDRKSWSLDILEPRLRQLYLAQENPYEDMIFNAVGAYLLGLADAGKIELVIASSTHPPSDYSKKWFFDRVMRARPYVECLITGHDKGVFLKRHLKNLVIDHYIDDKISNIDDMNRHFLIKNLWAPMYGFNKHHYGSRIKFFTPAERDPDQALKEFNLGL